MRNRFRRNSADTKVNDVTSETARLTGDSISNLYLVVTAQTALPSCKYAVAGYGPRTLLDVHNCDIILLIVLIIDYFYPLA